MAKIKIKPEAVYSKDTDNIRAVKDISTFGGRNMWNLEVRRADGIWESVQWMNADSIEPILGVELTRYEECDCHG